MICCFSGRSSPRGGLDFALEGGSGQTRQPLRNSVFVEGAVEKFLRRFGTYVYYDEQHRRTGDWGKKKLLPKIRDPQGFQEMLAPEMIRRLNTEPEVTAAVRIPEPHLRYDAIEMDERHRRAYQAAPHLADRAQLARKAHLADRHQVAGQGSVAIAGGAGHPCQTMRRALQYRNEGEMSIANIRALDLLKLAAAVAALTVVVAGCAWISRSLNNESEGDLDKYFLRDVATVEAMGLPVYWLGREFTVDGLVFRGPYGADFGNEVDGGINMHYLAPLDGGNAAFDLTVYSRDAWDLAKERVSNPGLPGVTRRMVTVGDREAELISVPLGARPVNILWLVLDLGDVVLLATAPSGAPDEPPNPLINPDNLIAVMQDLRPYPQ